MVRCVRCIVFFDAGDGIRALQSRGRLRNRGVVIDTAQGLQKVVVSTIETM